MRRAVVLLSGGLDSAVTLASARADGFDCYALSVDYGQRHARELDAAKVVAAHLGAAGHVTVAADLRATAASALTGASAVPKDRTAGERGAEVPSTYVPARNTVLLALALGYAETLGARDLFIGANALDSAGYPDCRPEFLHAFEALANLGTRSAGWRVHAPLLRMTKAEIVTAGVKLGVDFALTWSCYDPTPAGTPCGRCDACALRREGFAAAGIADPAGT